MTAFACSVLAVANGKTMSTLYEVSTDWTFDTATLFSPDGFYHPRLSITTWEQGKAVWRMEGNHGENTSTMSKWVHLKEGIPTEVIGIPTVAPSDPALGMRMMQSQVLPTQLSGPSTRTLRVLETFTISPTDLIPAGE